MLYIYTGVPGASKTLYLISETARLFPNRRVFYNPERQELGQYGITLTELGKKKLKWIELDHPTNWPDVPDGSVVIIDEAWQYFKRLKSSTSADAPRHYSEFAPHRHRGIDVILATQRPVEIDGSVRARVYQHKHFQPAKLTKSNAHVHVCDNKCIPIDTNGRIEDKRDVSNETYTHKKKYYKYYISSEMHTVKRRISTKVVAVSILMVLAISGIVRVVATIPEARNNMMKSELEPETGLPVGFALPGVTNKKQTELLSVISIEEWSLIRKPRIDSLPMTAPIYDKLTSNVKTFPIARNCISSSNRCQCYTDQGTKINTDLQYCQLVIDNGYFDPYRRKRTYQSKLKKENTDV